MTITKHGYKRLKVRLGIPKRASLRHIEKAWRNGFVIPRESKDNTIRVLYNNFNYIFRKDPQKDAVFITTYREKLNQWMHYMGGNQKIVA